MRAKLGVGAVFVLIAVLVPMYAAQATAPGKNGRIAFRRYLNANHTKGEIFTINPNGAGLRQVTDFPGGIGAEPDWSPNGRWIVYSVYPHGDEGRSRIFKIRPNGRDRTQLASTCTGKCLANGYPAWSPSGRRIAFQRELGTRRNRITALVVMRSDGTHAQQVTKQGASPNRRNRFADLAPAWAPNGKRLAFERLDQKTDHHAIFTVRLDGTGAHRITPWRLDASQPDYSPNGDWILFRSNANSDTAGNLWLVHPNGSRLHAVTHAAPGAAKWLSGSFSPTGRRINAARTRVANGMQENADVYVMHLDGSGLQDVTNSPDAWESASDWGPKP
jgi:TolB protein